MQVRDILTNSYKNSPYTIVNIGSVFVITMCIDGKLHRGHIVATRTFFQRLLGKDYTKKQLDDIAKFTSKMAESTIDTVLKGEMK